MPAISDESGTLKFVHTYGAGLHSGDTRPPVHDPRWQQRQVEDFVEFAALAEELGYDGITLTEHHAPLMTCPFQAVMLETVTGFCGLAVAAAGAILVTHGLIPPTMLPLLVLISVAAFLPVSEIAQVGRQLADTIASTRRLAVVQAEPVPVSDGLLEPERGVELRFDQVVFAYPGRSVAALKDVSFSVPQAATVAIVGPSGAGKTTVANLILRFWDPSSGSIRLDGIDLRNLTLDGLRSRIALVAQDTYLFNDTLGANVRLARPEASDEQVALALSQAALAEFIESLPDGLRTCVGERGVQLSGGQRQRIAIARAFLKDAPLLILDEATSHLDTISEQAVRRALDSLMADRTTIVIAHRLSTIRSADLILVMRDGEVIEAGTHEELLSRGGILRPSDWIPNDLGTRVRSLRPKR